MPTSTVKQLRRAFLVLILTTTVFGVFSRADAQPAQWLRAKVSVISLTPARLRVELDFQSTVNSLSFRNSYGGALGLAERIEMVQALAERNQTVVIQKVAPGQFQFAPNCFRLVYDVNVAEPAKPGHLAQISWLNREQGLLMPADLLPQLNAPVQIRFELPQGWTTASNLKTHHSEAYETIDPETAVFLVGPKLVGKTKRFGSSDFSVVLSGQWPFSDGDALNISKKLIEEYSKLTGFQLESDSTLMLLPFPAGFGREQWSAEARGNNVVLLLGNKSNRAAVLSRLGLVLSHELFHLWVPNSLRLTGNYDWFFEGFTLYQSLRTDLRLKLISFESFLDTVARVYESYLAAQSRDELSLVEASERRWTNTPSYVYDKGLLVAFLYDLTLRSQTDCEASSSSLYRPLFQARAAGQENGNETIIKLLSEAGGMASFVKDYVEGKRPVDLEFALSPYGLQVRRNSPAIKLSVATDLNKNQRKLLQCLGYKK